MSKGDDNRKLQTAMSLHQAGNLKKAAALYRQLIERDPDNIYALHNLGLLEATAGNHAQAKSLLARTLAVQPFNITLMEHYATMLFKIGDYRSAIHTCQRGLQTDSINALLLAICALSLAKIHRLAESLAQFDRLLVHHPDHIDAIVERGAVLGMMEQHQGALASFDQAIALDPEFANAHLNRGSVFWELRHFDEAFAAYDRAFALSADLGFAEGGRLHSKLYLCDWTNFDEECIHLRSSVLSRKVETLPFTLLAIPSSADEQLQCARLWITNNIAALDKPTWRGERYRHGKIRVAYLSADFHRHPVSFLAAGMFEHHDRSHFEISGISTGPDDNSEIRKRLAASFDHFVDANAHNDDQVAELVRAMEVDILVDLSGLTQNARTNILARRPAPIQVNFLGYPGTMGADFIDYIVADRTVIPDHQRLCYAERIVRLPHSYLVGDAALPISERTFTRAELGLPPTGFVFCCFNNSYKITPQAFDSWMRILKNVEGSVLWLGEGPATAMSNLRKEAQARAVGAQRLIFAKRLDPLAEHLARHRAADLFLDTLPYNAHATASHALWTGLPVLTRLGETFAGRVGASLLHAIGLPELITTTSEAYEALAIELAANPARLAEVRQKLTRNRLVAPLFDTSRFTKDIEAAYTEMHQRHQAGLTPADICVPSP